MGEKVEISAVNGVGRAGAIRVEIIGTTPEEVAAAVERLGRLPESVVSVPARYAAGREAALSKQLAPRRSGLLRGALKVSKKEHTRVKGKAVFDVRPMSEREFSAREDRREAKGHARRGYTLAGVSGSGKRYYYPASMEYGWVNRAGNREDGRYYLKRAAEALNEQVEQIILDRAGKKLDQLWERAQAGD